MSHSPARTELRYNLTSKSTKDDMRRIILTQGQELLNAVERAHQLEAELQAAKATITALKDEVRVLNAKVEQDAATLRKMVAQANSRSPSKEDIARCCEALGKKAVSRDELMEWLKRNSR